MFKLSRFNKLAAVTALVIVGAFASITYASHSWGGYHWARTSNPFTLKLGDNLSSAWKPRLATTTSDWSLSSVLDAVIVPGISQGNCRPTNGRVEVCNKAYGYNGWLGLAQIWVSGNHIYQGVTKMNDTYFNTPTYNTLAWRQSVICQEVGHTLGLDHQDENFSNPNLGTCMDYTSDPSGALYNQLDNEHPNQHDYDQLAIIYSHLDGITTIKQTLQNAKAKSADSDLEGRAEWGKEIRKSENGRNSLYERDLGKGQKVYTFVIWAN